MKKTLIFFAFVLFSGFFIASCSNDSSDDSVAPSVSSDASIIGKWNYNKIVMTANGVVYPETDFIGNKAGCSKNFMEIKAGGGFSVTEYVATTCTAELMVGSWVQQGKLLNVTLSSNTTTFEIIDVTSTTLKMKHGDNVNGYTLTFTKG